MEPLQPAAKHLCNGSGCGVVFELQRNDNGQWKPENVYTPFTGGNDGGSPIAGLVSDSFGHLYGTTWLGGAQSSGVVFELTPVSGRLGAKRAAHFLFCGVLFRRRLSHGLP